MELKFQHVVQIAHGFLIIFVIIFLKANMVVIKRRNVLVLQALQVHPLLIIFAHLVLQVLQGPHANLVNQNLVNPNHANPKNKVHQVHLVNHVIYIPKKILQVK
jgi:hypothetical protein